ncbi:peptide chain release factor N(5)-glutamine methyltransferase [Robiginitalea sp. M366]|uniref:peptide chain release factor N(5)-glutamine methyltransferase n=1 Tax=Robiginitalea aestuariiviva TaxID=3036903 RepID=UPI00240D0F3A|nr:peptide chain release factor N(5)-glutamine methyltransferase [Robiginitalea aestuariiviva]MDG1573144.1 peptide chain release factor N(5)-glutamine methyltransferase [Robiginitalea aestuariiviva]
MLLREIKSIYHQELREHYPAEEIDSVFYEVLEVFTGLPRFVLGLEPGKILAKEAETPLFEALSRLKQHVPVQYVTGRGYFLGMTLKVTPAVLIPRPETEELVAWITHSHDFSNSRLLDLGTGSGCIAIALARHWPGAQVCALELSAAALEVALENARNQEVKMEGCLADMCQPLEGAAPFDLMVSNPPYIPEGERRSLDAHVRDQEPGAALFAPEDAPLAYYHCLLARAKESLRPGGWLYLEIHRDYAAPIADLLRAGGLQEIQMKKDIFGNDRFLRGRKPVSGETHQPL